MKRSNLNCGRTILLHYYYPNTIHIHFLLGSVKDQDFFQLKKFHYHRNCSSGYTFILFQFINWLVKIGTENKVTYFSVYFNSLIKKKSMGKLCHKSKMAIVGRNRHIISIRTIVISIVFSQCVFISPSLCILRENKN